MADQPIPGIFAVLGHVNANPVGEYQPGELVLVEPGQLKARRPGWNYIKADDGRYYLVKDAVGNPLYPGAIFDRDVIERARIDRSEWPAADAPHVVTGGES